MRHVGAWQRCGAESHLHVVWPLARGQAKEGEAFGNRAIRCQGELITLPVVSPDPVAKHGLGRGGWGWCRTGRCQGVDPKLITRGPRWLHGHGAALCREGVVVASADLDRPTHHLGWRGHPVAHDGFGLGGPASRLDKHRADKHMV